MFSPLQVIVITLLVAVLTWQKYNLELFAYAAVVFVGFISGLVMGDVQTGLLIGGEMCLMSLGIGGYGGSSVPDYMLGAIAGTVFAIGMGQHGNTALTTALAIGVPVAALGVQLDVVGKMTGSFFIHKAMACSDQKDWKGMGRWIWLSQIPFCLLCALPILLLMTVGSGYVKEAVANFPVWLSHGLNVASGMLPALGFAILLKYLPVKKYGYFMLFGFVLASYLKLGILAIALLGGVFCAFIFQTMEENSKRAATVTSGGDNEDE